MKTKLSFLFLVSMLFSISIFASDPETTTYSNIQNTETGSIKEFTTFRANSTVPVQKSTYRYDLAGNIQEKVVYKWDLDQGWIGAQKLEYEYDQTSPNKPIAMNFSEWDARKKDWKTKQRSEFENRQDGSTSVNIRQ